MTTEAEEISSNQIFDFEFDVLAPVHDVIEFHRAPGAFRRLTPPPLFIQEVQVDPLGEGSLADFYLWIGFIRLKYIVEHVNVRWEAPQRGIFTDHQLVGPMQRWRHTHTFSAVDEQTTRVTEHIEYAHQSGVWGVFTLLLYNAVGLKILFLYRRFITKWYLEGRPGGQRRAEEKRQT